MINENLEKLRILQELFAGHALDTAGVIKRWCDYDANYAEARYCTEQILEHLTALEDCIFTVRRASHDIMRIVNERWNDEADDDHR